MKKGVSNRRLTLQHGLIVFIIKCCFMLLCKVGEGPVASPRGALEKGGWGREGAWRRVLRLLEAGKQGEEERLVFQVWAEKFLSNQPWSAHRGQKDHSLITPNILCTFQRPAPLPCSFLIWWIQASSYFRTGIWNGSQQFLCQECILLHFLGKKKYFYH